MKRVDARIYALTGYVKLFFIPPWKRSFNFPLVLQNMRLSLRPENLKKFRAVCRPFLISHLLNKRNYSKLLVKTGKKQVDRKKSPNILPPSILPIIFHHVRFPKSNDFHDFLLLFFFSLLHFWSPIPWRRLFVARISIHNSASCHACTDFERHLAPPPPPPPRLNDFDQSVT